MIPSIKYAEQRIVEVRQQAQYSKPPDNKWYDISDYITYTPNWLHADGRIYASEAGEEYKVAEVSPYNPNFRSQIEEGVWPLVSALTNKGYLTCSSCEGHGWDLNCRVSLVTPSLESATKLVEELKLDHWDIKVKMDSQHFLFGTNPGREIWSKESSTKTTKNTLTREELKLKVFPYYNKIFCRNYEEYFYIDMHLSKYCGKGLLWNWATKTKSKRYKMAMQQMIDHITNKLPYSVY